MKIKKQILVFFLIQTCCVFSYAQDWAVIKDKVDTLYQKTRDQSQSSEERLLLYNEAIETNDFILANCQDSFYIFHAQNKRNTLYYRMGQLYLLKSEYSKARPFLESAYNELNINLNPNPNSGLARIIGLIALENGMGFYRRGEKYVEAGEEFIKQNDGIASGVLTRYYIDSGELYRNYKKYPLALLKAQKALEYAEGDNKYIIDNLLANIYDDKEEYERSIELHQSNIDYYRMEGDSFALSIACLNMSPPLTKNKAYNAAINIAGESLDLAKLLGDKIGMADAHDNLSDAYRAKGELDSALFHTHQSLLFYLGEAGFNNKDINSVPSKKEIEDSNNIEPLLEYLKTKIKAQREVYRRSWKQEDLDILKTTIEKWNTVQELFLEQNKYSENRIFWNSDFRDMYEIMIDLAYDAGDLNLAYIAFEKSRAVILREQLRKYRIIDNHDISEEHLKELNNGNIKVLERYPGITKLLETKIVSLDNLKNKIASNQTMIYYFVGKEVIYALGITKENEKLFRFGGGVGNQNFLDYKKSLIKCKGTEREEEKQKSLGNEIYDNIFNPLLKEFENPRFIIVPDDELYGIAFGALYDKGNSHYLIEDYAFSYIYSGEMLLNDRGKENKDNFAGFAPMTFGEKKVPLLHSNEEVSNISEYYRRKEIYVKDKATKSSFKRNAGNFNNIHISSHGAFQPVPTLYFYGDSALILTEITEMSLGNVDMACLSACNISEGKIIEGEGVMSLARAFILAGVDWVVAPQTKIREMDAKDLFERFHANYKKGEDADLALQEVKKYMLHNPKYNINSWSQILVIGNVSDASEPGDYYWMIALGFVLLLLFIIGYKKQSS